MAAPRTLLEVIATSPEDAREAAAGGAGRLEVVRDLDVGGLTPPLSLVEQILGAVTIPVRVMLRETADFVVGGPGDMERLLATMEALGRLPVDGVVLGFLDEGRVDLQTTGKVLAAAPKVRATFHRAFEETTAPLEDIAVLHGLQQIDRILTSGPPGDWPERAARLEGLQRAGGDTITILAGGGMTIEGARYLREHTSIREFHIGAAARQPCALTGKVSAKQVARFRAEAGLDDERGLRDRPGCPR